MIDNTINDAKTVVGDGKDMVLAGRYHILRRLGQGGMGSVWLAEDRQLDNRKVAIKMLPTIVVQDKRAYQQLKGEALVSLKLIHPNIVTLRAFEENNGAPFLVMDYVEGQTLSDYLAVRGKLSEAETIKLLKPIAAALDYAHSEKVIHRDVKPSNIIIRKDGHPFILDFGIAREIQESMTRVTGGTISGTLLYMSPEQLRGAPPAPAQDVYSFAAMAYECLKGEPPFIRGEIAHQILNEKPVPLSGGSHFVTSIMAGLAKKPKDRPKDCASLLEDAVSFSRKGRKEQNSRWSRPALLAVSVGLVVALLVSLCRGFSAYNMKKNTESFLSLVEAKKYKEAVRLIDSIDVSNVTVQSKIGWMYEYGYGVSKDEIEAVRWYYKAAGQGNAIAQTKLGLCYEDGLGVSKDKGEAVKWYLKAADKGDDVAQLMLGLCFQEGEGVDKNTSEAVKWYRKAAEQGNAVAQSKLGICYWQGLGVVKDTKEAFKWFCKSALQGDAIAQGNLGICYKNGIGVAEDKKEAVKWFRVAAEQGNVDAQVLLGLCYSGGDGVDKNEGEAVKWYHKAAEQGNVDAQSMLGFLYDSGVGVEEDMVNAVKWYRAAAGQGDKRSQEALRKKGLSW